MRRGRLQRWAELLLFGSAVGASPAAAQSPIQVPEGCGSEEEFRSEIARLTGAPADAAMPSALHIEAIAGEPGGYELRLALRDELRVLRDPDCRILWRSAIVIAAAAARNESPAAASPPPREAPSPPEQPAPPVPPPAAPPAPVNRAATAAPPARTPPAPRPKRPRRAAPPRVRRPEPAPIGGARARRPDRPGVVSAGIVPPAFGQFRAGLELGLGVSGGVLPDLGGVLDAGGRLELLPWAVDVSMRYWPERSESREGRTVDVSAIGARIAGLYRVADALAVLAGIELNRLVGEGAEGVSGRNADAVWQLAPTLGFSLITLDIGSLRLEVGATGRLSVARPSFVVTGFGTLYRVPLVGADAIIRGVWLFW